MLFEGIKKGDKVIYKYIVSMTYNRYTANQNEKTFYKTLEVTKVNKRFFHLNNGKVYSISRGLEVGGDEYFTSLILYNVAIKKYKYEINNHDELLEEHKKNIKETLDLKEKIENFSKLNLYHVSSKRKKQIYELISRCEIEISKALQYE